MKNTFYLCLSILMILFLAVPVCLSGQQNKQLVDDYLQGQENTLGLTEADISGLRVTDEYTNRKNGIIYIYLQQTLNGIDLRGATANGVIKEGRVYRLNADRLIANAESRTAAKAPMLNALAAVQKVAGEVGLVLPGQLSILELEQTPDQATSIDPGQFALEPVTAKLVYNVDREETFRLAWEVQLYEKNAQHHWLVRVDALNGAILFKKDQVLHCDFGHPAHLHAAGSCQGEISPASTPAFPENLLLGGSYLVFPQPVESPNHGDQALVTDVENLVASPYGWHDTDAIPGPEFTITRGNNVHAYDDVDDDNASNGLEPDGGADLLFNYPFDPGGSEADVREAAIVNLFYWCNLMHDVWYQYGFDEVAGNFQVNNYGNGGEEGDPIRAEAQDGSGTNNANFNSGGDGSGARIQMYLWTSGGGNAPNLLTVNTPGSIADTYGAEEAIFGPGLPADPLTGDLILVNDGSFNPTLGCFDLSNGNEIEGKIALVDRGLCSFVQKVQNAQDVGAIAVIVCNDEGGNPFQMGGDGPDITIPSVMISEDDCMLIKTEISSGVNVTLDASGGGGVADFKDGDFDSGIISHEYGHGLSIRMTGGPSVGNCLFNDEQMGEGWSDYATLMMTMEEGDQPGDIRGVGTYALNEPIDGVGIRPAPYSTDFGINDYTYGNTNGGSLSQPHGIGFVWCTMLWDLTWALIDEYGFDPDIYNGTGGNNIAMHLVTEGMKLQACTPGFVDGRDGILLADELFYNSQNRCIIWEAFAKRGLGFSADQGSSNDRNDQVEAFDLAPWCLDPEFPPIAGFLVDVTENCFGVFNFTNTSSEVPQSWLWDFGDGNTSQAYNTTHTYAEEGVYEVQLIVTNTLGADTTSLFVSVDFPDPATPTSSATACEGTTAVLTATAPSTVFWYLNGIKVAEGDTYEVGPLEAGMVLEVTNAVPEDPITGGPTDNNFGTGGYHNTGFTGTVLFEAHQGFVLESVFVDADGDGNRLIELFDQAGNVVNSVTVFMPNGQSQVELNLEVPGPGNYAVGGSSIALYRNDAGAMYPYEIGNVATITGSPAGGEFYYYLYNWVVRPAPCESLKVPVDLTILDAPDATFEYVQAGATFEFTDLTSDAVSWLWDFGDGNTSTEENPVHTYAQDGTYTVTLTVENAECSASITEEVVIELVGTSTVEGLEEFELFPVPGAGTPQLNLVLEQQADIQVQVINNLGQIVWQDQAKATDRYSRRLDLTAQASGTYFIAVQIGDEKVYKRYVLMR